MKHPAKREHGTMLLKALLIAPIAISGALGYLVDLIEVTGPVAATPPQRQALALVFQASDIVLCGYSG